MPSADLGRVGRRHGPESSGYRPTDTVTLPDGSVTPEIDTWAAAADVAAHYGAGSPRSSGDPGVAATTLGDGNRRLIYIVHQSPPARRPALTAPLLDVIQCGTTFRMEHDSAW